MQIVTYYTPSHESIAIEGKIGTVGITEYAHQELGDIVYVDLPSLGSQVQAGEAVCVLESTKAAVDVYAPMSGKVIALNPKQGKGEWLFQIELSNLAEANSLLSLEQYEISSSGS